MARREPMPRASHVGKAGQLAVMSEYLLRGYNVAMPEVDEGDDIFVVRARMGAIFRIQVKTAVAIRRRNGYSGTFSISRLQLETPSPLDLDYVLALRQGVGFWEFLVIPRTNLYGEHSIHGIGNIAGSQLI